MSATDFFSVMYVATSAACPDGQTSRTASMSPESIPGQVAFSSMAWSVTLVLSLDSRMTLAMLALTAEPVQGLTARVIGAPAAPVVAAVVALEPAVDAAGAVEPVEDEAAVVAVAAAVVAGVDAALLAGVADFVVAELPQLAATTASAPAISSPAVRTCLFFMISSIRVRSSRDLLAVQ